MPASPAESTLRDWLLQVLPEVPPEQNLLYLEWNETSSGKGKAKTSQVRFSLFGLQHDDLSAFDPEADDDLDRLSDPEWDAPDECRIPSEQLQDVEIDALVKKVLKAREIKPRLAERVVAFGEHEGDVQLFPAKSKSKSSNKKSAAAATAASPPYFELSEKPAGNFIESYEVGDFDEEPLLEHDRVKAWPKQGIQLFLQPRPKLKDFLYFYRGWVVCTERAAKLFAAETDKIQLFPAPLFVKDKQGATTPVEGYVVMVLYEKLNCLPEEYVLPPATRGGPKEFHPGRGYKVKISETNGRQVFRINYENYRLVVTEKFRQRLESEGITGLQWLRRSSVA